MAGPVPILLYHSVSERPHPVIGEFAVTPATFRRHLDAVVASGRTPMTVAGYLDAVSGANGAPALASRPVVLTFDDGWVDFYDAAAELVDRGLVATLFATTGMLGGRGPGGTVLGVDGRHGLPWSVLKDLAAAGIEVAAHSITHPHLDCLPEASVRAEICASKAALEDELQEPVATFAYPHGYSSPTVRRIAGEAGFRGACGVKDALSAPHDDRLALARLTVRRATPLDRVQAWLDGRSAPLAPPTERVQVAVWRAWRRGRAAMCGGHRP